MPSDDPKVWRKKRGGVEYGSYYASIGGRIVNLGTIDLEAARATAKRRLEELAGARPAPSRPQQAPAGGEPAGAPPGSAPRPAPSPLSAWAAGGSATGTAAAAPGALATQAAPPPSASMVALADGLATALARFNAAAVAMTVRHLANVQPPKVDPDEVEALEKTWSTGLQELMLIHGLKWWHILLAQNGALALNLWQNGKPLEPVAVGAPSGAAAAAK